MPNGIGQFDPRHSSQTHQGRSGTVATDHDATDEVPNMYGSVHKGSKADKIRRKRARDN